MVNCQDNGELSMKVLSEDLNAVCSVTELAKTLGLSRARFYQLQKMGIFPMPIYCIRTRRPFYTPDLRQICVDIRKTGDYKPQNAGSKT